MATGLSVQLLPAEVAAPTLDLKAKLLSPELPAELPSRPLSMRLVSASAQGLQLGPLSTLRGGVFCERNSIDSWAGCAWVTKSWFARGPF